MNTIIEARTRNYNKILQLRGKLEMIVKQVNTQDEQGEFKLKFIDYNLFPIIYSNWRYNCSNVLDLQ